MAIVLGRKPGGSGGGGGGAPSGPAGGFLTGTYPNPGPLAWWTVDSTPDAESFAVGEHRTLFGDGSEVVVSNEDGAFTEYRSDDNEDDESTGKVFVGIESVGADYLGEFTAWTGQGSEAERRVTVWSLSGNDDEGNIFVQRPSTDSSNYLVFGDENGDVFEVGPTGAVTITPSDVDAVAATVNGNVQVLNTASGSLALYLHAASGQSEDLLAIDDENDETLFTIGPTGAVTITPNGSETLVVDEDEIGFFGTTPAPQSAEPTTMNEVVALLQSYGLSA